MPLIAAQRTWFTTLLGLAAILIGGLGSIFSVFALLLAIGKPYANNSTDLPGIFLIFILPPGTLLAGIGLLLRWRWARWWMIVLLLGIIGIGVKGLIAPDIANPAYAPKPGPVADAVKRSVMVQSIGGISVGALILFGLFTVPVRREFSSRRLKIIPPQVTAEIWLVGHRGRDHLYYEELYENRWRQIEISGEMLMGTPHHVIYFASPQSWLGYPEWARFRRDEIVARIKSRLCEPDYEYYENGTIPLPMTPNSPPSASVPVAGPNIKPDGTILPAVLGLIFVAAASFWFVFAGIKSGETRLPARVSGNHHVTRSEKPTLFWISMGLLVAVGTASTAASAWLMILPSRHRRQSH